MGQITEACAPAHNRLDDAGMRRLRRLVRERTGLDLAPYKPRFLERRVAIRQRVTRHERLDDYLDFLGREAAEMDRLTRCLTIHVSSFFRNPSTFAAIRDEILPRLFAPGTSRRRRFWSVGCCRGEEPYSLAILVREHLGSALGTWDVQIHATDVDDRVLAEAKAAEFGAAQIGEVGADRIARHFTGQGRWRLAPELRRMVQFHRRDVLMDPPDGEYDCILCRNLLIYLDRPGQEAVFERFARALRPEGFLVLGRTEVFVGAGRTAFEVVDARERIYRRLPDAGAAPGGKA
ncbi:MAG TPA: protein-glutamate O-methyltransferase CheR [Candidatus Methanoperedens sp.]|nr:protein-glutamate O-methyltransferase CheR [Candidatus Methanoperedens sp.]